MFSKNFQETLNTVRGYADTYNSVNALLRNLQVRLSDDAVCALMDAKEALVKDFLEAFKRFEKECQSYGLTPDYSYNYDDYIIDIRWNGQLELTIPD